jgi:gliding motility-associated-like protein
MKIVKYLLILIVFVGWFSEQANATHIVGGDTRFEQTGRNTFTVKMRLFRFCSGISYPSLLSARVFNSGTNASVTTITMSRSGFNTISFGDACYTPPGLCVEVYNYTGNVTLPDNASGYYVTYSTGGRNGGLVNLISGNSTWFCEIPDPALAGGNSSPKFIDYPNDGYFCVGYDKQIDFSCTDSDGDSLVYSLQNPYNSPQGTGGAKPIGLATYKPGFSLTNIMGTAGSCTIDPSTGIVTANPSQLGIFVVAVRCEEYRNGVKIGEVFRDLQYAALNCVVPTFNTDSVCFGDSITFVSSVATAARANSWDFGDGSPISTQVSPTHSFPAPGIYNVTHISYRVGSVCKDTAKLPVVVLPSLQPNFQADTICEGSPTSFLNQTTGLINTLSWNFGDGSTSTQGPNVSYTYSNPGTYTVDLTVNSSSFCSNTISNSILVKPIHRDTIYPIVCDSFVSPAGKIYRSSGIYSDTLMSLEGCDSIVVTDLTFGTQSFSSQTLIVCDSFVSPSGKSFVVSGVYFDTIPNRSGCDSIITFTLTVNKSSSSIQSITVCDSFVSPSGKTWNATGNYQDTILNAQGCDSVMIFNLTVNYTSFSFDTITVCDGYVSPSGKTWTTSGNYQDTIPNISGCDSIISVLLTVNNSSSSSVALSACDSVILPSGRSITTSGVFLDTIPNSSGCDSIVTFSLTINYSSYTTHTTTVCDSLISPSGKIWKSSGVYQDTVSTNAGCDSIFTYNLTVNQTTFNVVQVVACDSYVIPTSGQVVNITGNYKDTIANLAGCDSIIEYDVFINYSSNTAISLTVCDSLVSPTGKVWKSSGSYSDTLKTSSGCDSILSYSIVVNKCKFTYLNETGCDSLFYKGSMYSTSQTVRDTLRISNGCDSIITCVIDITPTPVLTISSTSDIGYEDEEVVLRVSGADMYTWQDGVLDSVRRVTITSVSQTFCVTGFNSSKCFADTCVQIDVKPGISIFAPNTFTPNGDGINDCFVPFVVDVSEDNYLFQVFNQWGEEVFSTTELNTCWDGTSQNQGSSSDIYIWKISCMDLKNRERFINQGHIFLNR